jgi:electron transport complex protein RnfE
MENKKLSTIFKEGIFASNPVLVSMLGLCPILAVSTSLDNAIGMSLAVLLVLLLSNITIALLRKLIPNEVRIPVFIILIATFVSCVDMLMNAFTPQLYESLGIFIPLIVVNCLILGRAEAFASKNNVLRSIMDAIGMALGFAVALILISFVREVLATQAITLSNPFNTAQSVTLPLLVDFKISLFGTPAGAFITLALILAIIAAIKNRYDAKKGTVK